MRMRIVFVVLVVFAGAVSAQQGSSDVQAISVRGASQESRCVPVSVPYKGPAPGGILMVINEQSGVSLPATLRDGELVFVVDQLSPHGEQRCRLEAANNPGTPEVQITKRLGEAALDVHIGGEYFTTFHYAPDRKKPFLNPVLGEGAVSVTRTWPMDEKEASADHHHQKSFWTSYGNVNEVDCWSEERESGYEVCEEVEFGSGDAYGWISAKITWQSSDRKPILTEQRAYRFYATPNSARLFDLSVTLTASHGKVLFKDTKEGGMAALRVRDAITEQRGGTITNATGATGERACWGKPAAWCDYSGTIGDFGVRGVAVFDHPSNLRHPTCWHVRGYGLMAANCFGYSHFTNGEKNGDFTLEHGDSVTLHYRIYVHSGDAKEAKVADRYADFATPPTAALGR